MRKQPQRDITSLELSGATPEERVGWLLSLPPDRLKEYAVNAASSHDLPGLWELTLAHLNSGERSLSHHTLRAYQRGVKELLRRWEQEDLLNPAEGAGPRYVEELLEEDLQGRTAPEPPSGRRGRRPKDGPVAPATLGPRLAAARALYSALYWARATTADPFREVRLGRSELTSGPRTRTRAYTEFELIELTAAAKDQQERVILLLGAHAGLRVSEMLRLAWEHVDLRAELLLVTETAADEPAEVAVTPKLSAALTKYRREMEASGEVRPFVLELRSQYGVYRRLKRLCERADVEFKGVQGLRHAAGARLYRQTRDLTLVQEHLRQSSLEGAQRYAVKESERLRLSLDSWE